MNQHLLALSFYTTGISLFAAFLDRLPRAWTILLLAVGSWAAIAMVGFLVLRSAAALDMLSQSGVL
jgi:hypothetical protein